MNKYREYLPYLAGLAISLIFGLSFMFTKQALDAFPAIHLLSFRFLLAALVLTVLVKLKIIKVQLRGKPIKKLMLLTLFQPVLYFIFETLGVKLTSSSQAGMMIALIPVVVTLFALIFLNERPTKTQLAFIILSVSGVLFIFFMSGNLSFGGHFTGLLSLLGAVLAAGVYNILSRKLSKVYTPVEITFVMMWVGAIVFNIIALGQSVITGNLNTHFSGFAYLPALVSVLYLGTLSSILAFFMVNYMLSKLSAARAGVFSNLTTVISIIAGVFIRQESFYWYQLTGGIMILAGVIGTNYFGRQKTEKAASVQLTE
ncbi:MAG: DMT family transporter [Bacillota bacterium]